MAHNLVLLTIDMTNLYVVLYVNWKVLLFYLMKLSYKKWNCQEALNKPFLCKRLGGRDKR